MNYKDDWDDFPLDPEDEDFDYLKEIEEIEKQEKELEAYREEKKARKQRELERQARREQAAAQENGVEELEEELPETKPQQNATLENIWEDEDDEPKAKTYRTKAKKKSKAPLVVGIVAAIAIVCGGGFMLKKNMDAKTVAEFSDKVLAFETANLDGVELGEQGKSVEEFFERCDLAIANQDLAAISELNAEWAQMETEYETAKKGMDSLNDFVQAATATLSTYAVTEECEEAYNSLMDAINKAKESGDFTQISSLQSQVEQLVINLTSSNQAQIQQIENEIAELDLDEDYMSDAQKATIEGYQQQIESATNEGNYAAAVATLNTYQQQANAIDSAIEAQKESEAAERRRQQQAAAAAAAASSSSSSSSGSSSSSSGGSYILSGSNSRYLSDSEVASLSSWQKMIARNEIYARRGRLFNDSEIQAYFNRQSWYHGYIAPDDFSASVFNDYEIYNIDLIRSYE